MQIKEEYRSRLMVFPIGYIIIVYCNFAQKQKEELQELVRFFKEYAPQYGYRYMEIEDNSRLSQLLGFQHIQSAIGKENYITKLVMD